ncbi:glycerol-3-phosphate dehydrogenase/oxidase [Arthrobacter bambusae]|uniref:glycerol-3-phosphate dehydrogenase/oxidase n=1 Tax=Arthrobacter bambusae TaxID=1338426 RepID=UPI0027822C6F|nr:glycerol-3-phosphate dehydrogenase/oxidase [Arthrobacter bambusae]MDQ0028315.1 glycerol-3-phosphate dehydrogenase [Arthrobacter bambusae]MDQ0096891.1 glycerol-3-phosphate dehydrogenase [Arthrobacter bambusae]
MGNTSNSGSAAGSTRRTSVSALRERPRAQVLIVGGGINGVGTFRDLALQGVDVALVERGDYCQGASGASSHMIHGGIRYLENGEFRLVQESVVERNRLLKIAPHYVKPLQTTIPIFSTFSGMLSAPTRFLTHKQGKPKERGAFLIKLGLSMYDFFSRDGGTVPRHQFLGKEKALAELPQLHPGIKYAATYFDASVHNPERLTLDVLQDGEKAGAGSSLPGGSARASNYVSLLSMDTVAGTAGQAGAVLLRDELTGEEFSFQADVIVNTTGAWVDLTNEAMGTASRFMGGTKGSHIVLDHPELLAACGGREIFFEHTDGRIVLIYPMGDRVLVGTTDVEADMAQDAVCTEDEIDYFFDLVGHVFPSIKVERGHIVYSFAGVRPLPRHDDTQPGFVSRDYRIERSEQSPAGSAAAGDLTAAGGRAAVVLSLIGGKWTTFRALAEHLSNDVLGTLGMERKVSTAKLPIGGGLGFPTSEEGIQDWIKKHMAPGLGADRVSGLLTRYGTRAEDVIAYLKAGDDRKLRSTNELSVRELEFMAANEQLGHLVDVLIRRTSLAFRGLVTGELLNEIAEVLGTPLGWDSAKRHAEIQHAQEVLLRFHGVTVHSLVA